jgi:hypothetical protein
LSQNSDQFHAYTNGIDTIIGTSLGEAIAAYASEIDLDPFELLSDEWDELRDGSNLTISEPDEPGNPKETKKVSVWIAEQIANHGDNFSRLLGSSEY